MASVLSYVLRTPTGKSDRFGHRNGSPAYFVDGDERESGWMRDLSMAKRFPAWKEADAMRQRIVSRAENGHPKAQVRMSQIEIIEIEEGAK